jgi:hypothetical protein
VSLDEESDATVATIAAVLVMVSAALVALAWCS